MLNRFEKHLTQKFPFLKDSPVLIAISGGVDSTILTHLMHELNTTCSLAHCNFSLRAEESDLDEAFIKTLGHNLNIPVFTTQFETERYAAENGISIQMAARDLRYNWFEKILSENNIKYVLTAHHKDDVLETFLINFTRGTGLDGLLSIPETNGKIIRPLLNFTRDEIYQYAKTNKILWREDKSNSSTKYIRNKIRHDIVPILKELNPNLLKSFDKTLNNLNESQHLINDRVESLKKHTMSIDENNTIKISVKKIIELNNPKAHLYELLKPYGFTAWKDIPTLLKAQSGKQLHSKTHRLIKNRDELLLTTLKASTPEITFIPKNIEQINVPICLKFSETNTTELFNTQTAYIDKDLLKHSMSVRKWQKGDYFYPIGMNGKKKLSKYFKDEKLSLLEKEKTWLLCNGEEIIWIIGKRLDNRYKVTNNTKSILKIEYITD